MGKFNFDDIVRVRSSVPQELRPGRKAWVVGVVGEGERSGSHYKQFPAGVVYTVEYEDGASSDIHESNLESA